jgi:hypothetical protein
MSAAGTAQDQQGDCGAGGATKNKRYVSAAKKADGKADQRSHACADDGNHDSLCHYLMLSDREK